MKKFLSLVAILLSIGTARATISIANAGNLSNISANSGTAAALDSASVGDEIVVQFSLLNQATALSTVTVSDNLNGSYTQSGTQAVNASFGSGSGAITVAFLVHVTTSGTPNITITTTGYTGAFIAPLEMRLTGFSGTGTLDSAASGNAQGTGTTITNAPGSTAHANEMALAMSRTDFSGLTLPSGWGSTSGNTAGQLYASSSSAVSFPATMSPSQNWINSIITVYDATGGRGGASPNFFLVQ